MLQLLGKPYHDRCPKGGRPYYRIARLGRNGGSSESDNGCEWSVDHDEKDWKMVVLPGRGATNIGGEMLRYCWQRVQPREDIIIKNDHALG